MPSFESSDVSDTEARVALRDAADTEGRTSVVVDPTLPAHLAGRAELGDDAGIEVETEAVDPIEAQLREIADACNKIDAEIAVVLATLPGLVQAQDHTVVGDSRHIVEKLALLQGHKTLLDQRYRELLADA